jgi:hypothetical protein
MFRSLFLLLYTSTIPLMAQQNASLVGVLPQEVSETSGIIFYKGHLITHNDSGNEPLLYELDTTNLEILRTIRVQNAVNTDWEDIAQDDRYIYIADIGNNAGNRRDLHIYRISKADYDAADQLMAEQISFTYSDQTAMNPGQNSDWDAEALIATDGQLLIFTKQWQTKGTKAYSIPATPGTHSAELLGSYAINGLVTGAVLNRESGVAYLCGYNQILQPFLLRIEEFDAADPFGGTIFKTTLNTGLAQLEGIASIDAGRYFLSTEKFVNNSPSITLIASLYTFRSGDTAVEAPLPGEELPPVEETPPGEKPGGDELLLFNAIGTKAIGYELRWDEAVYGRAIYDQHGRRVRYTIANDFEGNTIDLSTLSSAVYYLTFYLQGKTVSKPFYLR